MSYLKRFGRFLILIGKDMSYQEHPDAAEKKKPEPFTVRWLAE